MNKLFCWIFFLAVAVGMGCAGDVAHAQNPSTIIRVLDASGVEGIAGVVLLVNPRRGRQLRMTCTAKSALSVLLIREAFLPAGQRSSHVLVLLLAS
jgi:hypothetical protein